MSRRNAKYQDVMQTVKTYANCQGAMQNVKALCKMPRRNAKCQDVMQNVKA